ncbi:MAG: hypothetical protein ACYC4D_02665 [Thermoleophilia bacterium]
MIVAILAYISILNTAPIADDYGHLTRMDRIPTSELWRLVTLQSPTFIRPLPFLQIWIFYRIFGLEWLPSHVVNVFMHGGTAFFLYWFLKKIGISMTAAFLTATLFLLTPLAPEAVSWPAGRFDVWCLMFMIPSLGLYINSIRSGSRTAFAGSMVLALSALLSKETSMILLVLFPVLEILFVLYPSRIAEWRTTICSNAFRQTVFRLLVFFFIFAAYIAMRYAIMGRLGNYRNVSLFGMPGIKTSGRTMLTLLSPLDALEVSNGVIVALRAYTGVLFAASMVFVVLRWKRASIAARRSWLFSVAFFISSLLLVFQSAFVIGISNYLNDSRFFYIPMAGFYGVLVIGLLEFSWMNRRWRAAVIISLAALIPVFTWGVHMNNQAWIYAARIGTEITDETYRLLPDPPPDSKIYIDNIPKGWGGHLLANGTIQALELKYNRRDLKFEYSHPIMDNPRSPMKSIENTDDGYLLSYDWDTGTLTLVHSPIIGNQ